jgi:hypothetical protein
MEILKEHEGEQCSLYRTLRQELREISKIDPTVADREARNFRF